MITPKDLRVALGMGTPNSLPDKKLEEAWILLGSDPP